MMNDTHRAVAERRLKEHYQDAQTVESPRRSDRGSFFYVGAVCLMLVVAVGIAYLATQGLGLDRATRTDAVASAEDDGRDVSSEPTSQPTTTAGVTTSANTASSVGGETLPAPPLDRPLLDAPLDIRPNSQEQEFWSLDELVGVELDVVREWSEASGINLIVVYSDRPDLPTPAILLRGDPDRLVVGVTAELVTQATLG